MARPRTRKRPTRPNSLHAGPSKRPRGRETAAAAAAAVMENDPSFNANLTAAHVLSALATRMPKQPITPARLLLSYLASGLPQPLPPLPPPLTAAAEEELPAHDARPHPSPTANTAFPPPPMAGCRPCEKFPFERIVPIPQLPMRGLRAWAVPIFDFDNDERRGFAEYEHEFACARKDRKLAKTWVKDTEALCNLYSGAETEVRLKELREELATTRKKFEDCQTVTAITAKYLWEQQNKEKILEQEQKQEEDKWREERESLRHVWLFFAREADRCAKRLLALQRQDVENIARKYVVAVRRTKALEKVASVTAKFLQEQEEKEKEKERENGKEKGREEEQGKGKEQEQEQEKGRQTSLQLAQNVDRFARLFLAYLNSEKQAQEYEAHNVETCGKVAELGVKVAERFHLVAEKMFNKLKVQRGEPENPGPEELSDLESSDLEWEDWKLGELS